MEMAMSKCVYYVYECIILTSLCKLHFLLWVCASADSNNNSKGVNDHSIVLLLLLHPLGNIPEKKKRKTKLYYKLTSKVLASVPVGTEILKT